MTGLIQELIGKKVRVFSGSDSGGFTDDGVLEACDGEWLRLFKNNEKLYFPLYNVRLIKILGPTDTPGR